MPVTNVCFWQIAEKRHCATATMSTRVLQRGTSPLELPSPPSISIPGVLLAEHNHLSLHHQDCAYSTPSISSKQLSVNALVAIPETLASSSGRSGNLSSGIGGRISAMSLSLFSCSHIWLRLLMLPRIPTDCRIPFHGRAAPFSLMTVIRKCIALPIMDKNQYPKRLHFHQHRTVSKYFKTATPFGDLRIR